MTQPFGGNWGYNHYSPLRNPAAQNPLFRDMPFASMLPSGMSSSLIPSNNMAFSRMSSNSMPYLPMLSNDKFQPFPGNRFSVPAFPGNFPTNQIPAVNRIPYELKPVYNDPLKIDLTMFNANQARQGFPLSPIQSLTLSNLIGNKPYSRLGFIDEQTHVSGFFLPSTYTLIKNPYLQGNSHIMLDNIQATPFGNNMRLRGMDYSLKGFGERNCLMPYF